jgi:hypothetical protein
MTNRLRSIFVALAFVAIASVASAQGLPPEPVDLDGPVPVPVDGGASLLLAGGAIAAIKRLKSTKKAV